MHAYKSLTTLWQAFVLVEKGAVHLLNTITIIQTVIMQKSRNIVVHILKTS